MIRSMTGYAQARKTFRDYELQCELRSVNNRYLDLAFRLPKVYSSLEGDIRKQLRSVFLRGRIDISVNRQFIGSATPSLKLDDGLFHQYRLLYERVGGEFGVAKEKIGEALLHAVLSRREIVEIPEELPSPEEEATFLALCRETAEGLQESRRTEGKRIGEDVLARIQSLALLVKDIQKESLQAPDLHALRLRERLDNLQVDLALNEERLHFELALLVEKTDITEEIVRFESHLSLFRETAASENSGKKLDFILQEMGRELNTMNSKSPSAELRALVLEAKTQTERVREQIQNIE